MLTLFISGKENLDTWSQKNSTHIIADITISLWTSLKNRKTESDIFKSNDE